MADALPAFDPSKPSRPYAGASTLPPFDPSKPSTLYRVPSVVQSTAQAAAPFPSSGPGQAVPRAATLQELSVPGRDAISDPFGNLTTDPTGLVGAAKGIAYLPASIEEHRDLVKKMERAGYSEAQIAEERKNNPAFNALFSVAAGPLAGRVLGPVGERLPGVPGSEAAISGVKSVTQPVFDRLSDAIAERRASKAEQFIRDTFERTTRQTVKRTPEELTDYRNKARQAINSIVGNKKNLAYTDAAGEEVAAGRIPQSLEDFTQAISQTKESIFERYNAQQQAAGRAGAKVDQSPIVRNLLSVSNDPVTMTHFPSKAEYARQMAERIILNPDLSTADAERAIRLYNSKLTAHYTNPLASEVGHAAVDDIIVKGLRRGLDRTVETVTGPGYQDLKNEYGALKEIQRDVVKATGVESRKQTGGGLLGRLGDIATIGELMHGVATLNPHAFVGAAGIKLATKMVERARMPNRAVKKMFEAAEKYYEPPPTPRKELPRGLPPPTLQGPQPSWIGTPRGPIPPESARFTTKQPPTGVTSREPQPPRRSTLTIAPEQAPAPVGPLALPPPGTPNLPRLPAPTTVSGPQPPGWTQIGQGTQTRTMTPAQYVEWLNQQAMRRAAGGSP